MAEDTQRATSDQSQAVMRNSALMATGTIVSRVTGVLRDITIAAALGSALLADTYALGNSLPNILYILVVGGALNAVFIPQLIRHMRNDEDGGDGYADRLLTLVGLILVALSVLAVLLAPLIVDLYSSSKFTENDLAVATAFARFCLPQIFFYGLYTMLSQVLNSRLHFGAPMFAPIINNIVVIATALTFILIVGGSTLTTSTITSGEIALLGIGSTVGVAAQAIVLLPVLIKVGYRFRFRFDFRGHGLGKAGSLAGWTIGLVLVNQIGFLVIARLATAANVIAGETGGTPAGLATYQRAFLVFMLPHSVITISLVTALLPRMSKAAADGNLGEVARDVADGMRLIGAMIIPCVIFLAAFGPMVGTILFGYGENRGAPATFTGVVVSIFALALLPFSLFYLCLRGWYSVEDTRTPFLVTVLYNVISIPLTIALFMLAPQQLEVPALALAYGLAYWVTLVITWILLRRRLGSLDSRHTLGALARMIIAGLLAAAVAVGAVVVGYSAISGTPIRDSFSTLASDHVPSLISMLAGGLIALGVYIGVGTLLRIRELSSMRTLVRARFK